jgi:archaellum component FlaC
MDREKQRTAWRKWYASKGKAQQTERMRKWREENPEQWRRISREGARRRKAHLEQIASRLNEITGAPSPTQLKRLKQIREAEVEIARLKKRIAQLKAIVKKLEQGT